MFGTSALLRRIEALEARVRAQTEVIDALCEKAGIDPVAADPMAHLDDAEQELVRLGKPIEAMKHHRRRTGSSLAEAKRAVDDASRR